MNIDNIHNANRPIVPKKPDDREQNVPAARAGQPERAAESQETQDVTPVPVNEETEAPVQERDTFSVSDEPRQIEELTAIVENMEESPREDALARVRERVEGGYYNTPELMNNLAVRLVNTGRLAE